MWEEDIDPLVTEEVAHQRGELGYAVINEEFENCSRLAQQHMSISTKVDRKVT